MTDGGTKKSTKSCEELQILAKATAVIDGRINDLVNNALGYLENYKDGLPKGLNEAAYMDYCRCTYLLFEVIPNHEEYENFSSKKKQSAFYESYMTLKTLVESDTNVRQLEKWLENRAKSSSNGHLEAKGKSSNVSVDSTDLLSRFEKLLPKSQPSTSSTSPNLASNGYSSSSRNGNGYSNHLSSHGIPVETEFRSLSRAPIIFPKSTLINTEKLDFYLTHAPEKILLLDVRSREDFARGHVDKTNAVVCIEPVSLRDNMNDENLEDTLVLAPENEQRLFAARSDFELIVYYDWNSRSNQYLGGPTNDFQQLSLYFLTKALYDRAFSRPLKRPPCLLVGGYEAWMEDIHNLAVTSNGTARTNGGPPKIPQPPPSDVLSRDSGEFRRSSYSSSNGRYDYARDINDYFRSPPIYNQPYPVLPYPDEPSSPVTSPLPAVRTRSYSTQSIASLNGRSSPDHRHPPAPSHPPPPPPPEASQNHYWQQEHAREQEQIKQYQRYNQLFIAAAEFTTGLNNLGNTCYMNCIIQCLAGTPALSTPFVDGSYKRWVNIQSKLGYKGVLAQNFSELVQTMMQERVSCVGPIALKNLSGRLRQDFAGYEQQDCQEFLTFILDGLHEDLNSNGNKERLKELTPIEEARRENMSVRVASTIEWERYLKSDFSLIVDTCQGQYQSKLRCLTCGHTSTSYNVFSCLSVPIPHAGRNQPVSLLDCFNLFTAEEILEGDDAWHCPKCKQPRRTSKKLHISRLPSILIVHLKRFHHRYDGSADKLETFVTYPTSSSLDLTYYWPSYSGDDDSKLSKLPIRGQTAPFNYDLYAVANHYGSLKQGHYTSFVNKGRKGWCLFDDARVTKNVHPDNVMTRHAYVLFFKRQTALA